MSGSYPFIDIAALDSIREGFAKGDAQLVLTHDLSAVLWVNGPGAKLFGFDRVEDMIGGGLDLPIATRRQIASSNSNAEGETRTVSVRLGGGLRSDLTRFSVSHITLPDGVSGLLLTADGKDAEAEDIISGLSDDSTHIALIDANSRVIAASPRFAALDISSTTLEDLVIEAADATDRIVKRRIRAGKHSVPGAIARLTDTPPMHLLCIIGDAPVATLEAPAALQGEAEEILEEILPEPVESANTEDASTDQQKPRSFVFEQDAPPARFIWKVGPDGTFSEISPDLAATIGPNAADVVGRRFADVANVFGFDPDGSIAALLDKRDTWSGKRLMWPVEGTDLRVPVELAALPVYSRDREFTGFRGFGLVRPAEAEKDPEEIGLVLAGGIPQARKPVSEPVETATPVEDDDVLALGEEVANDDSPVATLPKPPLDIAPTPGRRESDKVISLLNACAEEKVAADQARMLKEREREERPEGGLTKTERNAFREIADRLRKQGLANSRAETETVAISDEPVIDSSQPVEKTEVKASLIDEVTADEASLPSSGMAYGDETALLANLPVPVIIHSGDKIHYVNQALLDLTGYESLDDIRGAGGVDVLFNSESDDGETRQGMVLRRANGSEEPVDAHLNAISWREGRALMLSLMPVAAAPVSVEAVAAPAEAPVAIDKDDEKQALADHVEELKTILDTATDGVVLIDPEGRIRSMNHSASALFGYERDETEGKFFSMLFAIESQRAAMDYLHGLSGNGVLSVLNDGREVIGREAKGGFIPLFMTIGKLPHTRGFCAVLRDITQWKRTEEELTNARKEAERASSQKTEFLARISHEIRTPLNAIIGFSELMADEKFGSIGNDRYRDYLRDINRSGNHVLALVNDLLDISKIEAGALDMQFEAVSLNDAIAEAIALMQPQANRERVIIRSSFQSNLPDIVADTRSIKQVALNLLSNAVRFTAPGGQVIVSTSYEMNGDVVMRVRDTGIGMTKSEVEQALKPFRQVNALERRKAETAKDWRSEGTGLGLPLTKAMVEANRAQFAIDSTPGHGTVVEIAFPPTRVLAD
ncbi:MULTISPECIES: cell-division control histidine kinase PdhS [Brucella/Ochrobactrum group]|uniref:Cell-division control histidine kinase PdhS n=1 Tax=Brucella anthropi (strain ATCC 49188 / DSM 6882 / CCUG 24695 / JCM 21032 / LMG 3331 / NBRC 15819 / NCTC 12168 / Alc 37) TaxID=439375 RepID=PDHS_BRUA4|nr:MULTISPECIES: cell-division control histidine kinase PdhS [Brucella/Ochrobactrum group]A6X5X4.1 RecName: Full=Cell-division control histidine kinase PdhS [Brucella anthropi ATCC 49188]ABS16628.1 PAS/PAC sensor signal transduction histidine kinase [Brucella anthropi ATCC 49188]AIK41606.1 cell-division control histidine kinase pdhS [Brucella anthropi]KAB2741601.1 PAS domain S-box protein [Brucella anthropi]KAB2754145.1 PAS domain S-box protein [Brucella anthropi]KAB2764762.1 PAS domain S-box